jgi:hypothetical protein
MKVFTRMQGELSLMRMVSTFHRPKRASKIRSQSKAEENARRISESNGEKLKK